MKLNPSTPHSYLPLIWGFLLALFIVGGKSEGVLAQETITIAMGDLWFCAPSFENGVCETTIDVGDTVIWEYEASASSYHTVTECGPDCDVPPTSPDWTSDFLNPGDSFSFTFTAPGESFYRCNIHPQEMRGVIIVQAGEAPAPTPSPTLTPTAIPTQAREARGPDGGDGISLWWFALIGALAGLALVGGGTMFVRRYRR